VATEKEEMFKQMKEAIASAKPAASKSDASEPETKTDDAKSEPKKDESTTASTAEEKK
jgi:hypothetical protein